MNNINNTNVINERFFYLSQIINLTVIDSDTGKKIGNVNDILASLKEMYPRASALIVSRGLGRRKISIPWKNIKKIIEDKAIFIEGAADTLQQGASTNEGEVLLKETLWDKQIVDINGSKVVRINDLHLLREDFKLWVVHADIGLSGLLRRLGCLRFVKFLIKLVSSYELEDRLISWKYVQPVTSVIGTEALSLKIHHSKLSELHPADLADILIDLGVEERISILKTLDNITAAHTFQELPLKIRIQIAELISNDLLVNIVNDMDVDEAVDLLSQLPKKKVNLMLSRLSKDKSAQMSELLGHSQRIAGSIMNTEFIAARHNVSAGMVLDKIKGESRRKESIYYIYVLDDNDILIGMVTLRQLLTVPLEKTIVEFMHKRVVKVKVETNIKDVVEVFYKYDFTVIPVVDKQNKIQGIITIKDAFESVFRQIRDETEENK